MTAVRRASEVPSVAREFQGHRAGIVTRVLACAVDVLVVLVALGALWVAWAAARFLLHRSGFTFPSPALSSVLLAGSGVAFVYLTASWATTGRSYGDQVMGLRVVSFRGERLRWVVAAARAALCVVFPLGLAWITVSPRNRSVQDVVLQTSVIYDWTSHPGLQGSGGPEQPSR